MKNNACPISRTHCCSMGISWGRVGGSPQILIRRLQAKCLPFLSYRGAVRRLWLPSLTPPRPLPLLPSPPLSLFDIPPPLCMHWPRATRNNHDDPPLRTVRPSLALARP